VLHAVPKSTRASRAPSVNSPDQQSKLYDVLDHLGKSLAVAETVARALEAAQNERLCSAIGAEIATLRQAVIAIRAAHEELDLAIVGVFP
jgi:hypothetical protein